MTYKNNANRMKLYYYESEIIIEEPECNEGVIISTDCCICPDDNTINKNWYFTDNDYYMRFDFYIQKDKFGFDKSFRLYQNTDCIRDNLFANEIDSIIIDGNVFYDIIVFKADTNLSYYQNNECKIWRVYYSKRTGIIRFDSMDNNSWVIDN